jgi:hypothetical protein
MLSDALELPTVTFKLVVTGVVGVVAMTWETTWTH